MKPTSQLGHGDGSLVRELGDLLVTLPLINDSRRLKRHLKIPSSVIFKKNCFLMLTVPGNQRPATGKLLQMWIYSPKDEQWTA